MFKKSDEFSVPGDDSKIWRYLDFSKFVAALEDQALYFARADRLGDHFEGSLPRQVVQESIALGKALEDLEENARKSGGDSDDDISSSLEQIGRLDRKFVAVSCWHISDCESDAMWRLYVKGEGEGIAIQSTVGRLKEAIIDSRDVVLAKVDYINYDNMSFDVKSKYSQFAYKREAFAHERELRAMISLESRMQWCELSKFRMREREPEVEYGLNVRVDLDKLVETIVISPGAKWLEKTVLKLLGRYDYSFHVRCTSLDALPFY